MATNNQLLNCPPLRFPEFSDEWQQIPNKQLFAITNNRNSNLQRSLILSASQSLGMTSREKIGIDIKYKEESISTYKLVNRGDYVIHLRSFQGGFAFSEIDGVCSPAYTILRPMDGLYYGFLKEYFRSISFINSLVLVTYGIRDGRSISVDEWMRENTIIPSLPEQKKIAAFLSLLDERIEAQRQTIKERKKQKKALLNQIFSQSLRFPEFSDEWQQTTLRKVCKVSTGEMNTQDKVEDGNYPFYVRSSTIERANRYTYDGIAILTPGDGAIGQIFHYSEGKIAVHQRVYMLTEMQCIPKYLFHYFSARFLERVSRMSAKNTVDSIRMNMITDMPIPLPSPEEQKKIAGLFTILDERIEVEEALLACYEAQKRYLLRQMFV